MLTLAASFHIGVNVGGMLGYDKEFIKTVPIYATLGYRCFIEGSQGWFIDPFVSVRSFIYDNKGVCVPFKDGVASFYLRAGKSFQGSALYIFLGKGMLKYDSNTDDSPFSASIDTGLGWQVGLGSYMSVVAQAGALFSTQKDEDKGPIMAKVSVGIEIHGSGYYYKNKSE